MEHYVWGLSTKGENSSRIAGDAKEVFLLCLGLVSAIILTPAHYFLYESYVRLMKFYPTIINRKPSLKTEYIFLIYIHFSSFLHMFTVFTLTFFLYNISFVSSLFLNSIFLFDTLSSFNFIHLFTDKCVCIILLYVTILIRFVMLQ